MKRIENIFLDRDGTLVEDSGYLHRPEDVRLFPGVGPALGRLSRAKVALFVVTNQSGIGRGYYALEDFQAVQERLAGLLAPYGAALKDVCLCPHHPSEACACRKPGTAMWRELSAKHGLEPQTCAMLGDNASDVGFGLACGFGLSALVLTGHGPKYAKQLGLPELQDRPWLELPPARPGWPQLLARDLAAAADYLFAAGYLSEPEAREAE